MQHNVSAINYTYVCTGKLYLHNLVRPNVRQHSNLDYSKRHEIPQRKTQIPHILEPGKCPLVKSKFPAAIWAKNKFVTLHLGQKSMNTFDIFDRSILI